MRTEIENFNRMELFKHYHANTNPFSFVTIKVDITNLYKLCKKNKNTYATIGFYIALAINEVDAFKYRYEDGKIYYYDVVRPNFTQMFKDGNIGYFSCDMKDNYNEFIEEYNVVQNKFLETSTSMVSKDQGEVWFSCEPWFNFSSCVTPFDKEVTIPQVIWDRFIIEDDRCYINMMIMSHHGFVDGSHIGLFINKFSEIVQNIEV